VLIIPSSWGSQLDGDLHQHRAATSNNFLAPLPGIEEEAPTSTTFFYVNYIFPRELRASINLWRFQSLLDEDLGSTSLP
jgi:hypothetical protein